MKRLIAVTLAFLMVSLAPVLSQPAPVYADGSTGTTNGTGSTTINTLSVIGFNDIEKEIMARNPTVQANQHLVDSTSYGYSTLSISVSDMQTAISGLDTAITIFQNTENSLVASPYSPTTTSSPLGSVSSAVGDVGTLFQNDNKLLGGISADTAALIGLYASNVQSFQANKSSLQHQLYQLQDQQASLAGTVDQVKLQTEMADKQLVWAAQSLYAAYNKIILQQQDLANNLNQLQKQLVAVTLQQSLGMTTDTDVSGLQNKINDLQFAYDNIAMQAASIKGDLNMLFGQDYDTPLNILTTPEPSDNLVKAVNYNNDIDSTLALSYSVRLETNSRDTKNGLVSLDQDNYGITSNQYLKAKADLDGEQLKLDDETRKFSSTFHKAYEDFQTKQKALNNEKAKLQTEFTKLNQLTLKHDLGMVSDLEYAAGQAPYQSEQIKVQNLASDLEMSYTKYQWMKQGLSLT
ncbi:MAG: TolC family protein [Desulfitobacteriaceae bacterium]